MPSGKPSPTPQQSPRGRILKISHNLDGTSQVTIDNGADKTITLVCNSETLQDLLAADTRKLHAHVMTRVPGHFRKK